MGNSSQTSQNVNRELVEEFSHPIFHRATLQHNSNQQAIIQAQISLPNQSVYECWARQLPSNPCLRQEGALNAIGHNYTKTGLCGSSGIASITFDYFPLTLQDQILNREGIHKKYFNQSQLWYLLDMALKVCTKFHAVGKKIGDIRPINIFLNANGETKLATTYSWPNQLSNYKKSYKNRQATFLSPEECTDLEIGRDQSVAKVETAQAFSLGLTLLNAALLYDLSALYDKNCKFNQEQFSGFLEVFKSDKKYTDDFKYIILGLTEILPKRRLTTIELSKVLSPFEVQIMELEPFNLKQMPEKVKRIMKEHPLKKNKTFIKMKEEEEQLESSINENQTDEITFSFGKSHLKTHTSQEKTQETTTLMRSQSSNLKTPSPFSKLQQPSQQLLITYDHSRQSSQKKVSRPLQLKKVLSSELLFYNKEPPKCQNYHPYYNFAPTNNVSHSLPLKSQIKVNFIYGQENPSQGPTTLRKAEQFHSKVNSNCEKNDQTRSRESINCEYFGAVDSMKSERPLEQRRQRSSSLRHIDEKIAFSKRMFPY